ncbi:MAG: divalent-cation tolerance protein CutA [Candidatus Altiarchaeota archaeon]|nr:divalent-cation tolerance protein CutA [Candidatus Altiarchaeota archaeon]
MHIFYVPVPQGKGKKIAKHLVEKGMAKCVNIVASESMYIWKGKVDGTNEEILLIKTAFPKRTEKAIREVHPSKLPAIIQIKAIANIDYERWLLEP